MVPTRCQMDVRETTANKCRALAASAYDPDRPPAHLERIANELYIAYLISDAEIIAHVTKIGETE